jgi:hypothetical protein
VQQLRLHLAEVPMLIRPLISSRIHSLVRIHHGILLSMFTNNSKMLREHYDIEKIVQTRAYYKSYHEICDSYPYPPGFRVPEFVKFTGEDNRTT